MSEQEFLIAIAELSIALIAFTNIVVALKQMGGGCLTEFQVLVVRLFSVCGFCAIFFGLLPIMLIYFELSEALIWRICNPLLAVSIFAINSWYFRQRERIAPGRPFRAANYITTVLLYASLTLLALGTFGIYFDGSIAPFAFTLVALLVASAVTFLNTLSDFLITPEVRTGAADAPRYRRVWQRPVQPTEAIPAPELRSGSLSDRLAVSGPRDPRVPPQKRRRSVS